MACLLTPLDHLLHCRAVCRDSQNVHVSAGTPHVTLGVHPPPLLTYTRLHSLYGNASHLPPHACSCCCCCCRQDLLAALVLSECVYKKLEMPPQQLADTVGALLADFPPDLVHLEALQLSRDDVTQK